MHFVKSLMVFLLLSAPALAADPKADSDLVYKAQFGSANDTAILIDHGANANAVNENGISALGIAAMRTDDEGLMIATTMLDKGATIDMQDSAGETALYRAASIGNLKMVKLLMERGANAYIPNSQGVYPRDIANKNDYQNVLSFIDSFLVNKTKDVNQKYAEYNSAIEKQYKAVQEDYEARLKQMNQQQEQLVEAVKKRYAETGHTLSDAEAQKLTAEEAKRQQEEQAAEAEAKAEQLKQSYQSEAFRNSLRALVYDSCAYQYWAYVRSVGVKSDLSAEQIKQAISTHEKRIKAGQQELQDTYALSKKYLQQLISSSEQNVYQQLKHYGSNATLSSYGGGMQSDAKQRCQDMSDSLDFEGVGLYQGDTRKAHKNENKTNGSVGVADQTGSISNKRSPKAHNAPKQPRQRAPGTTMGVGTGF